MVKETKTFQKLKDKPRVNYPKWLIVHHTGGTDANPLADTSHHTALMVEEWHIAKGWDGLGYTYFINKDGEIWAGRPESYTGAHTVGYNNQSIGICLAGNFDSTVPTDAQISSLRGLLSVMMGKYNIEKSNIVPHRKFATKTCYGKNLPDTWAQDILDVSTPTTTKKTRVLKLIEELKQEVLGL